MSWLDAFRWRSAPTGNTPSVFGSFWPSSRNSARKRVDQNTVLTLSTAWACGRILSESAALCPVGVYQKLGNGGRRAATEHPAYAILHDSPNGDIPAAELWENVVAQTAFKGNAYGLKLKVGARVVGVELLPDPDMVSVYRNPSTWALGYRFYFRNKAHDVGPADLVHWKAFSLGGDVGLSAIHYGANVFGIAMAGDDTAGKQFAGSTTQPGFIQAPQGITLKPEQRAQFQKSVTDFRANNDPDKIFLLEAGFEWKTFGINPNDLQMLQTRQWSVEDVCRFFRVPPHLVGHTEPSTSFGAGLENQTLAFLTFSLAPYLNKIQGRNNLAFLTQAERDAGYYTEANIDGLLRADSAGRGALYSIFAQNGILDRNEIRALENKETRPGGDQLTVQSNLVPLDKLGELTQGPSGGSRDANVLRQALIAFIGTGGELPPAPKP